MMRYAIDESVQNADENTCKEALSFLLSCHFSPVFGSAKSIEHEVAAFQALQRLGFINDKPDEYEVVMALRVTKAKARSLLYQTALRELSSEDVMESELKKVLVNARVLKGGDNIYVEVVDPLLMDYFRQRIRSLGYLSDGSFSGTVAKIPTSALAALIAELIPNSEHAGVQERLRSQGVPGTDLQSLIKGALSALGKRSAGTAGEQIGDQLGEFFAKGVSGLYEWARSGNQKTE